MADFNTDSTGGNVQSVFLSIPNGGELLEIFPTSYTQKDYCQMIGSPSEMGLMTFDNKVRMPSTVQLTGIVKYENRSIFDKLRKMTKSKNLGELRCTFQSKADEIQNMIIESVEEVGSPNRYDAMEIKISLQEYMEHGKSE